MDLAFFVFGVGCFLIGFSFRGIIQNQKSNKHDPIWNNIKNKGEK